MESCSKVRGSRMSPLCKIPPPQGGWGSSVRPFRGQRSAWDGYGDQKPRKMKMGLLKSARRGGVRKVVIPPPFDEKGANYFCQKPAKIKAPARRAPFPTPPPPKGSGGAHTIPPAPWGRVWLKGERLEDLVSPKRWAPSRPARPQQHKPTAMTRRTNFAAFVLPRRFDAAKQRPHSLGGRCAGPGLCRAGVLSCPVRCRVCGPASDAESTQIGSLPKRKHVCASRRARSWPESVVASWPAKRYCGSISTGS